MQWLQQSLLELTCELRLPSGSPHHHRPVHLRCRRRRHHRHWQAGRIVGVFAAQMVLSVCGGVVLAMIMPVLLWTPACTRSACSSSCETHCE
jgi:hypothetical protein